MTDVYEDKPGLWDEVEVEGESSAYVEKKSHRPGVTDVSWYTWSSSDEWDYPTMSREERARVIREFVSPAVKRHVRLIYKTRGFTYLEINTDSLAGPPGVYMLDQKTQKLFVEETYKPTEEEEDSLIQSFREGLGTPGHVAHVYKEMHPDHEMFTIGFASDYEDTGWAVNVTLIKDVMVDGHHVRLRHDLIPWLALHDAAETATSAPAAKEAWDLIVEATGVKEWARPVEMFSLQTAFPETMALLAPNVEPFNATLVDNLFYKDGPRPFHVEGKRERDRGVSIVTMAALKPSDASVEEILASTGFRMTATDHRIQEFAASAWDMGERSFTTRQLLEKMGFDADNPDTVEEFENRIQVQRRVLYDVDFTAEMRQDAGDFRYYNFVEPVLRVVEEVQRSRNGKLVLTWTLMDPPIYYLHAKSVGQLLYMDMDLMNRVMDGVKRTAANVNLAYELVKHVTRLSNPNNSMSNHHIRYDTLLARANVSFEGLARSTAWKRKQSAIKTLKNYLRNLKKAGVITGFRPYEKNGKEVGIKITPIKDKAEKVGPGKRKALGGGKDA